ncbi:DUF3987 domain-containing protein [Salmonella enterica]|nr:DUF3987 domain-containing protein [Salmonella enterica]EAT8890320.1 DUF3987 domain-containing protein [Salmonella enterica subsp. arizonae serovar 53:z4,z23,z32:-]EDX6772373.1 DUF3987 domain-containing protein [Salmonella enterica subsp. arizonae serovar 53:z4,z24:-]EAP4013106.1 DUF3987 domain-containing protein [Salmonella enterica]EAT1927276.1 DUF3987 domain-containing protein [Salmonella enterica]
MMTYKNIISSDELAAYLPHYSSLPLPQLAYQPHIYPVSEFPDYLRKVIEELATDVQAPPELVGGAILSAISLACQAFINVQFPDGRTKPCSLYNMVLAGSGERKSAIYSLIIQPFLDYEKRERQEYEKEFKLYETQMLIWKNRQKLLIKNLMKKMKEEEDTELEEYELEDHNQEQPAKPRKIKLIYTDTTPEALQRGLYDNIPFAGSMSDEANIFFAGRAKNNLSFLNQLWDGSPFDVERRHADSFSVDGKFSMLLMIQHDLFMHYFKKHGKLASGSGFLSRFLISSVNSTQGARQPSSQKNENKELKLFHEKISFFLSALKKQIITTGEPALLKLSPSAYKYYDDFQEKTESLIFYHKNNAITSFLSKAPENAIRLAALMTYFEDNSLREIPDSNVISAINIMHHYVNQAIFLFIERLSTLEQDAEYVYNWIFYRQKIIDFKPGALLNKVAVQRNIGRVHLRNKIALDAAIKLLVQQGKICIKLQHNANGSVSEMISYPDEF